MAREATGQQAPDRIHVGDAMAWAVGQGLLWANGGCSTNPMGFPGYGQLYWGNDRTYRWMLQHPVLRLVRSICVSPIVASSWEYVKTDPSVPDSSVDLVSQVMNPLRIQLLNDFFIRGRDHGWASGEIIWEQKALQGKERTIISRVKPLLQESTQILHDDGGNPIALRNHVGVGGPVDIAMPYKGWLYTYDGECGYLYGRSWLENVRRTAWADWLDCAQQLMKLGAKITGILTVVTAPAGSFPTGKYDASGKEIRISYKENAETVIKALASGEVAGAFMPGLSLNVDAKGNVEAYKVLAQLAGKSLITVDTKDFGGNSPAITGILERMKHDEELMFMGGLRPARTGLEGVHGTKAEAGVHTDTGTTNSENDDKDFARQCQPLVNSVLAVNVSEKARDSVRISCPSLVDRKSEIVKAILLSICNVPELAAEVAGTLDIPGALKFLGLQVTGKFDAERVKEGLSKAKDAGAVKNPEPQGGRPKGN